MATTIRSQGGQVTVYDPQALDNARRAHPELAYGTSAKDAAADAHVVLLLTEWREFRDMDPEELGAVVAERNMSTAATPSTRSAGAPPAGTTARWAAHSRTISRRGPGRGPSRR